MDLKVLAVIPAYNEEDNIVSTVDDLLRNAPGVDYVVVNDGSSDLTARICRERGFRTIDLPVNLGLAGGFQTGMKFAYEHGYDYALQFDADGQHSAAYVWPMVQQAQSEGSDIVIGLRDRVAGESYLSLTKSVAYMLRVCLSILFIQWFRKKGD